ncbi:MAG: alpha/beta hydrolase [Myxococcaceae bacterium]|nr:alpha/beta hydrolase [Myxococcaceae bacterium]
MSVFEQTRTLTCAGVETATYSTGSGPALLFLHGNPDTHHAWEPVVERLRDTFTCHAADMPGYGASAPQLEVRFEEQIRWVDELIAGLGLERPHLVAHDVGGTYGLLFAATSPERLSKLTVFNANFFPDYHWHFWGRVWRRPVLGELTMAFAGRGLFVNQVLKAAPKLPRAFAERAFDHYGKKTRAQVLRYYRHLDSSRLAGWPEKLAAATKTPAPRLPMQVIWGDRDPYIPPAFADRFGGEVHHLPDVSHWAMMEAPELVAPLIRGFALRR